MIMYEIWATLFQDWSLWFCMQIFWVNNSNPFLSVIHYLIINMNTRYSFKNWFLTFKCVKQCRPRRYLATLLKASFTNLKSIFNFQFFWNHHGCISLSILLCKKTTIGKKCIHFRGSSFSHSLMKFFTVNSYDKFWSKSNAAVIKLTWSSINNDWFMYKSIGYIFALKVFYGIPQKPLFVKMPIHGITSTTC